MEQDPKRLIQKLSDAMVKIEEAAESEVNSSEDYLQVCGALMAVTRNLYIETIGADDTAHVFASVADSFYIEDMIEHYEPKPTIH